MNIFQELKTRPLLISFLISLFHCVLGTFLSKYYLNGFFETIFLPYTFIAGMSNFAGWDWLSYILEFCSLIFIAGLIYLPVKLFLDNPRNKEKEIKDNEKKN